MWHQPKELNWQLGSFPSLLIKFAQIRYSNCAFTLYQVHVSHAVRIDHFTVASRNKAGVDLVLI